MKTAKLVSVYLSNEDGKIRAAVRELSIDAVSDSIPGAIEGLMLSIKDMYKPRRRSVVVVHTQFHNNPKHYLAIIPESMYFMYKDDLSGYISDRSKRLSDELDTVFALIDNSDIDKIVKFGLTKELNRISKRLNYAEELLLKINSELKEESTKVEDVDLNSE